VILKKII